MHKLFAYLNKRVTIRLIIRPTIWGIIITGVAVLLLAYGYWEIYWLYHTGYPAIKWHTHLAIYIYLGYIAYAAIWLLRRWGLAIKTEVTLLTISLLSCLILVEGLLIARGTTCTYMEKVNGFYYSAYQPYRDEYYHIWDTAQKTHLLKKPEYSFIRHTNIEGCGDEEWKLPATPGQKRIMALGDSFTEGDGAPYDSTYVTLMKQLLQPLGPDSIYIMNAGVCGSDPCNNYIILKDRLLKYKPRMIIQSWSANDMTGDIMIRGGLERFEKNRRLRYRPAPWWEPVYAVSNLSRLCFSAAGYTELLLPYTIPPADVNRVNAAAERLVDQYAQLCHKEKIKLVIVFHPEKGEIIDNKYLFDLAPLKEYLSRYPDIKVVDLLPAYRRYIDSAHSTAAQYFWEYDNHHNSDGYRMMAITTLDAIRPLLGDSTIWGHSD